MQRLLENNALTVLALFYTAWIELLATIKTCTSDHSNELMVANWQDIFTTEVHTWTGFIATILKTLLCTTSSSKKSTKMPPHSSAFTWR